MHIAGISALLSRRIRSRGMRAGVALPIAAALLSVGVGAGAVALAEPASAAATSAHSTSVGQLTKQAPAPEHAVATVRTLSKTAPTPALRPHLAGLAGYAVGYRYEWCGVQGDFKLNLSGLGVYDGQAVAVTISEVGGGGSEFLGSARMTVHNVAVWGDVVSAWVTVEWGSPLCVWTHYTSAG